eukprot:gene6943-12563_t
MSQVNGTNETVTNAGNGNLAFGIFVEFIFLWTLIGNIIIISVLKLYKPLTIPDILVFSLALSDLLNVLLPAQMLNLIQSRLIQATWNESICIAFTWSVHCLRLSSVLTVSVIAVDRLLAIRKPLVYRSRVMHEINRVKVLILLLWLFSCFTASLPYMGQTHSPFKNKECHYQLYDLGITYGFFVEIVGLLQLVLVLYCYIAIRISTWHFMQRQGKFRRQQLDRMTSNPSDSVKDQAKRAAKNAQMKKQLSRTALTKSNSNCVDEESTKVESTTKVGSLKKHFGSKRKDNGVPMLTEGMKQVAKMEKMMAVLVLLFYISWLPFLGSNLFSLVTGKSNQNVIRVIGVFSLINGFLNPIVYATIYPRYKKGYIFAFQTILRVCGGRKPTLTTADFNSSKIGRSRRLRTLRELKSNASMTSTATLKEDETPYHRDIERNKIVNDVILEELPPESRTVKNLKGSNENPCNIENESGCISNEFTDNNGNAFTSNRVLSPRGVRLTDCVEKNEENHALAEHVTVEKQSVEVNIFCSNPKRDHTTEPRDDQNTFTLPHSTNSECMTVAKGGVLCMTNDELDPDRKSSPINFLPSNLDSHYHSVDDSSSVVNRLAKLSTPLHQQGDSDSVTTHQLGIQNDGFT